MINSIYEYFKINANNYPEKIAIICNKKEVTYSQLMNLTNGIAKVFLSHNVYYNDHIGVLMNNSVTSVALFLAASKLGLCIVPLNSSLPYEMLASIIKVCNIKHFVANEYFYNNYYNDIVKDINGKLFSMDPVDRTNIDLVSLNFDYKSCDIDCKWEVSGDEDFILTMTSGSTGKPKPISLTQRIKIKRAFKHIEKYSLLPTDIVFACTPLYHSLAERLVFMPLILGGTVVLLERFTPEIWVDEVNDYRITFSIIVSSQVRQIYLYLKDTGKKCYTLRKLVSSSALLDNTTKSSLLDILKCEFHEMYGTSETSTITDICVNDYGDKIGSVGNVDFSANVKIVDESMNECQYENVGEIVCKTDLMFKGYYGIDNGNDDCFFGKYFRTGDLGHFDKDGFLYFDGRKKDLIITGGINVYPNDIDEIVSKCDGIVECAAFSMPDDRLGEVVGLAVVKSDRCSLLSIKKFCAKHLANYQQPHNIYVLDELPKNHMGKLQRFNIIKLIK